MSSISVRKLILLFLGSVAFVIIGIWIAGVFDLPPKLGKEWAGWLSIAFFGPCSVVIFFRLFDDDDQVSISSQGIYLKQWSAGTIPWSEISDVTIWAYKEQKSIILHLRNPERYPSTTILGKLAGLNRAITGGDIAINLTGTNGKVNDAIAAIEWFQQNLRAKISPDNANMERGFGKKSL